MNRRRSGLAPSRLRQQGIVAVMGVIFVLFVVVFALGQTLSVSASNAIDTSRQADSIEALFLAESAMENVAGRVAMNPTTWTCTGAFMGVGETPVTLGRGTYEIVSVATTDFTGATLASSMCRVRVRGQITSTNVTRTLETVVGKIAELISIAALNPDFNLTAYTGARTSEVVVDGIDDEPDAWDFTYPDLLSSNIPWHAWDKNGGNGDGSRAAFSRKTKNGSDQQTAGGAFTIAENTVVLEGPIILRLTFDYRVWADAGGGAKPMRLTPYLESYAGGLAYTVSSTASGCGSYVFCSDSTTLGPKPDTGCGYTDTVGFESYGLSCPTPPTGTTGYQTGFVTVNITTSGTIKLKTLGFTLQVKSGKAAWTWLDNLRLTVPALLDGSPNKQWREVSF